MGHDPTRWQPTDPKAGDFSFQNIDPAGFDPDDWPAEPSAYRPTTHFRTRYQEYGRLLDGDIIHNAITGGDLIPAADGCGAFYTTHPGIVFYIIVGWDHQHDSPREEDARAVVTGWPWVFDRDEALDSGRYSTRVLNRMMDLNGTLYNEGTADHDWLTYYAKG